MNSEDSQHTDIQVDVHPLEAILGAKLPDIVGVENESERKKRKKHKSYKKHKKHRKERHKSERSSDKKRADKSEVAKDNLRLELKRCDQMVSSESVAIDSVNTDAHSDVEEATVNNVEDEVTVASPATSSATLTHDDRDEEMTSSNTLVSDDPKNKDDGLEGAKLETNSNVSQGPDIVIDETCTELEKPEETNMEADSRDKTEEKAENVTNDSGDKTASADEKQPKTSNVTADDEEVVKKDTSASSKAKITKKKRAEKKAAAMNKVLDQLEAEQEAKRLAQEFGLQYNWLEKKINGESHKNTTDGVKKPKSDIVKDAEVSKSKDELVIIRVPNGSSNIVQPITTSVANTRPQNIVHPSVQVIPRTQDINYRPHMDKYKDMRVMEMQRKHFERMKEYHDALRNNQPVKHTTPSIHERLWVTSGTRANEFNTLNTYNTVDAPNDFDLMQSRYPETRKMIPSVANKPVEMYQKEPIPGEIVHGNSWSVALRDKTKPSDVPHDKTTRSDVSCDITTRPNVPHDKTTRSDAPHNKTTCSDVPHNKTIRSDVPLDVPNHHTDVCDMPNDQTLQSVRVAENNDTEDLCMSKEVAPVDLSSKKTFNKTSTDMILSESEKTIEFQQQQQQQPVDLSKKKTETNVNRPSAMSPPRDYDMSKSIEQFNIGSMSNLNALENNSITLQELQNKRNSKQLPANAHVDKTYRNDERTANPAEYRNVQKHLSVHDSRPNTKIYPECAPMVYNSTSPLQPLSSSQTSESPSNKPLANKTSHHGNGRAASYPINTLSHTLPSPSMEHSIQVSNQTPSPRNQYGSPIDARQNELKPPPAHEKSHERQYRNRDLQTTMEMGQRPRDKICHQTAREGLTNDRHDSPHMKRDVLSHEPIHQYPRYVRDQMPQKNVHNSPSLKRNHEQQSHHPTHKDTCPEERTHTTHVHHPSPHYKGQTVGKDQTQHRRHQANPHSAHQDTHGSYPSQLDMQRKLTAEERSHQTDARARTIPYEKSMSHNTQTQNHNVEHRRSVEQNGAYDQVQQQRHVSQDVYRPRATERPTLTQSQNNSPVSPHVQYDQRGLRHKYPPHYRYNNLPQMPTHTIESPASPPTEVHRTPSSFASQIRSPLPLPQDKVSHVRPQLLPAVPPIHQQWPRFPQPQPPGHKLMSNQQYHDTYNKQMLKEHYDMQHRLNNPNNKYRATMHQSHPYRTAVSHYNSMPPHSGMHHYPGGPNRHNTRMYSPGVGHVDTPPASHHHAHTAAGHASAQNSDIKRHSAFRRVMPEVTSGKKPVHPGIESASQVKAIQQSFNLDSSTNTSLDTTLQWFDDHVHSFAEPPRHSMFDLPDMGPMPSS